MAHQSSEDDNVDGRHRNFTELLNWHLRNGTRSDTALSGERPWDNHRFAAAVGSVNERSVRNWRRGVNVPSDLASVERVLFGDDEQHRQWSLDFRRAYEQAKRVASAKALPADGSGYQSIVSTIPGKPARCFGRDGENAELLEVLTKAPLPISAIVLGGPGMGKTTLTLQVATNPIVVERFEQRRWFIPLETAGTAEALQAQLIRSLGLDPATERFEAALARLAEDPALLVLDNLETPWEADRIGVEACLGQLAAVSTVAMLASMRGQDAVLSVRWAAERLVGPLSPEYSKALFRDIALKVPEDDPHWPDLLDALGGVPLAIVLVAQRAAARDRLSEIWEEWQRVGIRLARRRGMKESRVSSVEQSITVSLESCRLGDAGRQLFRMLGQLPAGIAEEDSADLIGELSFDAESDLLAVGLAFLREDRGGSERLDLLPPVRDFAYRLHPPLESEIRRWTDHYIDLARNKASRIGWADGGKLVDQLIPELPNIEAAVRTLLKMSDHTSAVNALDGIYRLMVTTGAGLPGIIQALAAACHDARYQQGEADCIRRLGNLALWRSNHKAARTAFEQALAIYRAIENTVGEANCIKGLGDLTLEQSNLGEAELAFERALALYQKERVLIGEADCILGLGDVALARGNYTAADQAFTKALPIYQTIGAVLGQARCIKGLGDAALARPDQETAQRAYQKALRSFESVGNVLGQANCIKALGDIALANGDLGSAEEAYQKGLPLFRQVRHILGEASCIKGLGDIALARSNLDMARDAYQKAMPLYRQVENVVGEAQCILNLGDIARDRSDLGAARTAYEQALELYQRAPSMENIATVRERIAHAKAVA